MEEPKKIIIALIGGENTGKTTFRDYLLNINLDKIRLKDYTPLLFGDFNSKEFVFKNKTYSLNIWDTSGVKRFKALFKIFVKESDIIFIFYNSLVRKSFENAKSLYDDAKNYCISNNPMYVLVCNKYDLYIKEKLMKQNIVKDEEALEFADKNNLLFLNFSIFEKYENDSNEILSKVLNIYLNKNR